MTTRTAVTGYEDPTERAARGRTERRSVPRSSHAEWAPAADRPDPVHVLEIQAESRVPELVPLRHERMLVSPFTFYRGTAAIMARDLAHTPVSRIAVQCCGDAHLANFGGFESPERTLMFDINDFDETLPGPWEWDIKRLATSFVIASQDRAFTDRVAARAATAAARTYREAMREFATKRDLEVWYARLDVQGIIDRWRRNVSTDELKRFERNAAKATSKNSLKALAKLTEVVDGRVQIKRDPPLLVRMSELLPADQVDSMMDQMRDSIRSYSQTLPHDRRRLLARYRIVDIARKVVGVGSVGTRCWIALLLGRDDDDPLFLQIKEAQASVLEPYAGKSEYSQPGQRVVEGQRLMQAASDIFLGWDEAEAVDGVVRSFYVRQLWDGKASADLARMPSSLLVAYGQLCGWTLARAHARSGDRIAIGAYLGSSTAFDNAIVEFAFKYAAQNARDYDAASAAARSGRLTTRDPVTP